MGSQLPAGGQGGLTPEALAAIQALGMQTQAPPAGNLPGPAAGMQMPAIPLPNVSPAPAAPPAGGIMEFLKNLFFSGTDAKTLAQGAPQPMAKTPEQLQAEREAAVAAGRIPAGQ